MDEFKNIRLYSIGFRIRSKEDYKLIPIIAWLHREFPLMEIWVKPSLKEEFYDLLKIQVRCDLITKIPPKVKSKSIRGNKNKIYQIERLFEKLSI